MEKKMIWTNINLDLKDYEDYFEEEELYNEVEYTEDEKYEKMYELNDMFLDDERMNLGGISLDGRVLVIADLGLWDGRKQGYKVMDIANLGDILYSESDYVEWFVEGGDLSSRQIHHDGTNYLMYREIKEDKNIDNLLESIYSGEEISRQKLSSYTKSLAPKVNATFGW